MKKNRDYVQLVADIISTDYENTRLQMEAVKMQYGLTYKEYYDNAVYEMTETQIIRRVKSLNNKKDRKEKAFADVINATGYTRQEISARIKEINQKGIFKIVVSQYAKFELYKLNEEQLKAFLQLLAERDKIKAELLERFQKIDEGMQEYAEVQPLVERFYQIIPMTLREAYKEEITSLYRTDLLISTEERDRIAVDIEVSRFLLGFSLAEYYAFRFWEKNLEEKREYLNTKERKAVLNVLNNSVGQDVLKNKGKCYIALRKYFHRKQVIIEKSEDYAVLKHFCRWRKTFVKKPFAESLGNNIEPIRVDKNTDYKKLVETLLDDCGKFVAEELIIQHPVMKSLNPDSVNTVRLETFYDGKKVELVSAFMRIGQEGAFVDNGGAGGIGVSIDIETGIINSDGIDEMGRIYTRHPYTGIEFKGYQLPQWKKALALGRKVGNKIQGATYIGWDLAYTKNRKWIIVEGNGTPQYIYNQSTIGRGLKKEFLAKFKSFS